MYLVYQLISKYLCSVLIQQKVTRTTFFLNILVTLDKIQKSDNKLETFILCKTALFNATLVKRLFFHRNILKMFKLQLNPKYSDFPIFLFSNFLKFF